MKGLRRNGFTMIELVIVIVIMGVMAFTAYKALMGSSDKNKAGTLIKSEFGEIRQNATDTFETSTAHNFAEIGGARFNSLFPVSYAIAIDANRSTFNSDIVVGCVWWIQPDTEDVANDSYRVSIECDDQVEDVMKTLISSKAIKWVEKEYDKHGTLPTPGTANANMIFPNLKR